MEAKEFFKRYIRKFVCDHMHYSGRLKNLINESQWVEVYGMADGFGIRTGDELLSLEWDWSHIRDSSFPAFVQMANAISARAQWHHQNIFDAARRVFCSLNKNGIALEAYFEN